MAKSFHDVASHIWRSGANLSVFLALLVLTAFVLPSVGFKQRLYVDVASSVMLVSGAVNAWRRGAIFYLLLSVVAIAVVLKWATWPYPDGAFGVWPDVLDLVAIAMIIVVLLLQVFATGSVTVARMQGAIAAYLGFGVLWAHAFTIAAKVNPGSFRGGLVSGSLSNWIYYSFETLTTLGYGDIVPLSQTARMLAVGEAITGQLYLAVLLAHLVSMRVSGALITKESTLKI